MHTHTHTIYIYTHAHYIYIYIYIHTYIHTHIHIDTHIYIEKEMREYRSFKCNEELISFTELHFFPFILESFQFDVGKQEKSLLDTSEKKNENEVSKIMIEIKRLFEKEKE